ncbi:CENP-Q, a CENPA-CAD centromere complex subunit-domain-containing protein [Tuber borchii]|uniref:CENP-Q, a CENPA-CAD centromere complex subunit-domain-containing protein n=1 Tax=Tuber borchii TaxID=42251 RepID=A0A2T7A5N1_TUBBO|nr:CENP-Q, a CENPA-CAD centromere complex subunit-domain-containing protein [Tuber borchii]
MAANKPKQKQKATRSSAAAGGGARRRSSNITPANSRTRRSIQTTTNTADATANPGTMAKAKAAPPAPTSTSASSNMLPPPRPLVTAKVAGTKRKLITQEAEVEAERIKEKKDESRPAKMPMLKPRVRNVPQEVVEAKWGVLSDKGREEVMEVVRAAERPVLMTFRRENRRAEAQEVLHRVVRKIGNSLTKVPVPPLGKDTYLNYEKLLSKNRALEAILEPDLRQIAGLEAEIEREQKLLEKEEDYLQELKKNAIAQENIRRQKSRNMHPILRNAPSKQDPIDSVEKINLTSKLSATSLYDVNSDRQLHPLTTQLQQHLTSMQGNSGSLGEVTEWIQKGKAVVDEVLFRKAGEQVYDSIMAL